MSLSWHVPTKRDLEGLLGDIEHMMRIVEVVALDLTMKMSITSAIDNLTMGFTAVEIIDRRQHAIMGRSDEEFRHEISPRSQELFGEGDSPLFCRSMAHDRELPDFDARFRSGAGHHPGRDRGQERAGPAPRVANDE